MNAKYYIALVAILISMQFPAKADYISLEGGDIIGESQVCLFRNQIRACVLVEKDKKRYQVVADQKGELYIYLVETAEENGVTVVKKASLLWARDSV